MSSSEEKYSRLKQIKMELKEWQERLKQIELAVERSHSSIHNYWKYLFVCGCARSGTTAITKLLNAHPLIAIGVERYKHYAKQDLIHKLSPALFKLSVFFDIREEQTNINPQHQAWENH
ncbi:MAG: sulfotransferase [Okeania sp. SIO2C2]|nr:hypothetical protein [Okeania sp. SIO2C2]NEP86465.1 sulfotransferase [Okeania sp. SIO2C2]